jgi:cyclic pyranopterin phosphate synthase
MRDTFDRDITYLRISVTDKCNLRCTYCMPPEGVPYVPHTDLLRHEEIVAIVTEAVSLGITKVRLTGGEPLVRRGIVELVGMIAGIPGIEMVAMTTNGTLMPRFAVPLKEAGLDRLNISLDTLDPERYRRITRGGSIADAIAGIDATVEAGFSGTKINMVILDDTSEADVAEMSAFCRERELILQRIAEYDLDEAKRDYIGVERPLPCRECNRIRLLSDGTIKPCLHSNIEIPVQRDNIRESLIEAIRRKPEYGTVCNNRSMIQIGG